MRKAPSEKKSQKNPCMIGGRDYSDAIRKIVLGGTTARRSTRCGGLYSFLTEQFGIGPASASLRVVV